MNLQASDGSFSRQANHDLLACGGSAWPVLNIARQLTLQLPELSVAVIDRMTRPLLESKRVHKVGETTGEVAANYFGKVLELRSA